MDASRRRNAAGVAGLVLLGLLAALPWAFAFQTDEGPTAGPAPTHAASAGASPSGEPSPSASASPTATMSPSVSSSPSASASAMPSASSSDDAATAEPSAGETDGAGERPSPRLANNTHQSFDVRWPAVDGASAYVVYVNGSAIARVSDPTARIIWDTSAMTFGVAAVVDGQAGPMATIDVERPGSGTSGVQGGGQSVSGGGASGAGSGSGIGSSAEAGAPTNAPGEGSGGPSPSSEASGGTEPAPGDGASGESSDGQG